MPCVVEGGKIIGSGAAAACALSGACEAAAEAIVDVAEAIVDGIGDIFNNEEDSELEESERELGDLEPMPGSAHAEPSEDVKGLSDKDLGEAIDNPSNDDKVKVRGNELRDGNSRIREAQRRGAERGFPAGRRIPVEELPPDEEFPN